MHWIEVTMCDSGTKRFERNKLNEIYEIYGKYSRYCGRRGHKASYIKFGVDNEQTGYWTPSEGMQAYANEQS